MATWKKERTMKNADNVKRGRNNKRKGASRELLVKAQLEAQGWCVTKAGGSMGVFDLIGIHPDVNTALCIQVKSNNPPPPTEREAILAFLVPNYCQKIVWVVKDRKLKQPDIYVYGRTITQVPYEWYLKEAIHGENRHA